MTSVINQNGLAIDSKAQITADLVTAYQAIYGSDINVQSNSPDGQLINIQAQLTEDYLELLLNTYNSFAIDTAYGERLDQLMALNGIVRHQGTYTQANVLVTVTQALTLPGLDQTAVTPFTVSDNAGNTYQLVTSHVFVGGGSATLVFQATTLGRVETVANTITNIVTATLGVSTVNNPTVAGDSLGVNEESDAQLRTRHARSLALASTGPSDAMEAALANLPNVQDAYVIENNTGSSTGGVAAHTVWPIVNGGAAVDIAQAIYSKKGPGCGLKGSVTQIVTRPNGSTFTAQWDVAVAQPLYVAFGIIWKGAVALSDDDIKTALENALAYKLGENPNIGDVIQAMLVIAPTAIVTIDSDTQGVSEDGVTWASVIQPTTAANYYTVDSANITIV